MSNIIKYSIVDNVKSTTQTPKKSTFKEFCNFLQDNVSNIVKNKEDLSGIIFCEFNSNNNSRKNENVESRTGFTLDLDVNPNISVILDTFSAFNNTSYTTHSHQTKEKEYKNRFRMFIPFSQPVKPEDWAEVIYGFKEHYKSILKDNNAIDNSCNNIKL